MAWTHSYSMYRNQVIETQQTTHRQHGVPPRRGLFQARIVIGNAVIATEAVYQTGDEAIKAIVDSLDEFLKE